MYAPDDGGFVVGFPREILKKSAQLVDVVYDENGEEQWCQNFISEFCKKIEERDDGRTDMLSLADLADSDQRLFNQRIAEGMRRKSQEFEQEKEVRLVCHAGAVKLRPSRKNNVLVPYVEIQIPNEEFQVKVAAGPGPFQNSIARAGLSYLPIAIGEELGLWNIGVLSIGSSAHRIGM